MEPLLGSLSPTRRNRPARRDTLGSYAGPSELQDGSLSEHRGILEDLPRVIDAERVGRAAARMSDVPAAA